jgi:hypothetical protein
MLTPCIVAAYMLSHATEATNTSLPDKRLDISHPGEPTEHSDTGITESRHLHGALTIRKTSRDRARTQKESLAFQLDSSRYRSLVLDS